MLSRKLFFICIAIISGLLWSTSLKAQATDYRFHSVFIYNFTKYIQWPESYQSGDFVIGVLGNSPIAAELEKLSANKTVGMQKIIVRKFKSADEIGTCHILFLPVTGSNSFEEVQEKLKGKHTLVITEKSGLAQKGSGINFIQQDNKWKFELNESATQSAGLKVSKELSKLAINV
jgi:hypothetical protein